MNSPSTMSDAIPVYRMNKIVMNERRARFYMDWVGIFRLVVVSINNISVINIGCVISKILHFNIFVYCVTSSKKKRLN